MKHKVARFIQISLANLKLVLLLFLAIILLTAVLLPKVINSAHPNSDLEHVNFQSLLDKVSSPVYAASVDYFLKIDGIPGESQDPKHKDEIDLLSWSWGATQTASSSGETDNGKINLQDFHFTMNVNKASPKLFQACASGEHIKNATLTARRLNGPQVEFLIITFSDLVCRSYQEKGDPQNLLPLDQISLNYTKIEIKYTPTGNDGKPNGPPVTASWDFSKNKNE